MRTNQGTVTHVNVAHVRTGQWGAHPGRTGIDKRPVDGRVRLFDHHVEGDTICDTANHGGPDQAVYAYDAADTAWWGQQLGRELGPGAFGENLTVTGVPVTDAVVGQTWQVGAAVLQVCVPRIPCRTFAWFWDLPDLVKRFTAAGRPGVYLRIVVEGDVGAGDTIEPGPPPEHGLTIGQTFRAMTGDRALAAKLLEAPQLPASVHDRARKWLAGASV